MEPALARVGQTHTEAPSEFGVAAGHERRGFFVTDLDEADLILTLPERLHDPIDPITRQAKDGIDAPVMDRIDEEVSSGLRHVVEPAACVPAPSGTARAQVCCG